MTEILFDALAPAEVLTSMDALNSHARAHGCGSRAVYAYKTLISMHAALIDAAEIKLILTKVKCRSCGGTGRFTFDWEWTSSPPRSDRCRTCRATGYVTLRFVQSTFGGRSPGEPTVRWHHPCPGSGNDILQAAWGLSHFDSNITGDEVAVLENGTRRAVEWEGPDGWAPNQGGVKLIGAAAAHHFNVVEPWICDLTFPSGSMLWWRKSTALLEMKAYALDLGSLTGPCWRCGTDEGLRGYHVSHIGRDFEFSVPICVPCDTDPGRWPKVPPATAMTPEITSWLSRAGRQAVRA